MEDVHSSLPEGWSAHFDDRYRHWYYHEHTTGSTHWTHPNAPPDHPPEHTGPAEHGVEDLSMDFQSTDGVHSSSEHDAESPLQLPATLATASVQAKSNDEDPWMALRQVDAMPMRADVGRRRDIIHTEDPWKHLKDSTVPATGASAARPAPSPPATSPWHAYRSGMSQYDGPPRCQAMDGQWQPHVPCLLEETVMSMMDPSNRQQDGKYSGNYVDCTFGRGGHTKKILEYLSDDARLWAFDVDPEAVAEARKLEKQDGRFKIIHRPFGDLAEVFDGTPLDGVLVDLGVSSPQLDDRHRGFNVRERGPLDLRMNQDQGVSARKWLQSVTPAELGWVIHTYGEDSDPILAERLAEIILAKQHDLGGEILWTTQLSDIIKEAKTSINDSAMHPAKLTFQSIRIFLNQEMVELEKVLQGSFQRLRPGGRCSVISFKKKEANAIIRFVREYEHPTPYLEGLMLGNRMEEARLCELFPVLGMDVDFTVKQVCEPIRPSYSERERNTRARSSAVYVLKKEARRCPVLIDTPSRSTPHDRFCEPKLTSFCGALHDPDAFISPGMLPAPTRKVPEAPPIAPVRVEQAVTAVSTSASERSACDTTSGASPSSSDARPRTKDLPKLHKVNIEHRAEFVRLGQRDAAGYLGLLAGDIVKVLFEGEDGDDAGWCYGCLDADQSVQGWFPIRVLEAKVLEEC